MKKITRKITLTALIFCCIGFAISHIYKDTHTMIVFGFGMVINYIGLNGE